MAPRVTTFADITSNPDPQSKLLSLYGNVDSIDLWVGGLSEDHVAGASVGPTFRKIMADQFERIRDGDRMWYARVFFGSQQQAIEQTRLSDIIRRNTTITKLRITYSSSMLRLSRRCQSDQVRSHPLSLTAVTRALRPRRLMERGTILFIQTGRQPVFH